MVHTPIDTKEVKSVSIVRGDDDDLIKWRKRVMTKTPTKKHIERIKKIEANKPFFDIVSAQFHSGLYEKMQTDVGMCIKCEYGKSDNRKIGNYLCWKNYDIIGIPKNVKIDDCCKWYKPSPNNMTKENFILRCMCDHLGFEKYMETIGIYPGNFRYYLKELGLISSFKTPWQRGKINETEFIKSLHIIDDIVLLPTNIKIEYHNNQINFNFLDALVAIPKCNKTIVIEYKSRSCYYDKSQITDYIKLLNKCNIRRYSDNVLSYAIVYGHNPDFDYMDSATTSENIENKNVFFYTENCFLKSAQNGSVCEKSDTRPSDAQSLFDFMRCVDAE